MNAIVLYSLRVDQASDSGCIYLMGSVDSKLLPAAPKIGFVLQSGIKVEPLTVARSWCSQPHTALESSCPSGVNKLELARDSAKLNLADA